MSNRNEVIRYQNAVPCDFQLRDAGAAVDVPILVEDEISKTVIDVFSMILLDGLQGVGVVANEGIGTGIDKLAGGFALQGHWLHCVFLAPMQRH